MLCQVDALQLDSRSDIINSLLVVYLLGHTEVNLDQTLDCKQGAITEMRALADCLEDVISAFMHFSIESLNGCLTRLLDNVVK